MDTTQPAVPPRVPRKGKTSGPVTEYCAFWTIKPGHAGQLVDEISAALSSRGDVRETYAKIGVHDARYVVFDNGRRLLITISYDLDFDAYFDDAIASIVGGDMSQIRFHWIKHLEETPEGGYEAMSWEDFKNFLVSSQIEADVFANTDDASVQEIRKALRVQKAFQQVLDSPEAEQAFQHPALKPLLDEAAG
jgi:hypothetical protein